MADDQSVSPKASGGGTAGVCSFFSVCMSVLRHSAWLMTDQSVSLKASGGGTAGVCSFFSVYVCAAPLCVADDQSVSPKASGGGTHGVCV